MTADLSSFENGRVTFSDAIQLGFIGVYSSLMYRRSARSHVDPSRLVLDLHWTWDVLSKGQGHFSDEVLGRYRVASSGSLTVTTHRRVRLLTIVHADEFLARFQQHRRDFLIWALCNALLDAKNRRLTALNLIGLAWRARSLVGVGDLLRNAQRMRSIQVPWRQQQRQQRTAPGT